MNTRPTVAIDVTPLLGLRTGIGRVVAEILDALRGLEAAPRLVPYTLSWRAREQRDQVPPETRFVPIPARVLLPAWARLRHASHRPVAAAGASRPRDELPHASEPVADARQHLRLLVRPLSRAVHARSASDGADRPAGGAPGRDGAHHFRVRRERDRGDLRAGVARVGKARRGAARHPGRRYRRGDARARRRARRRRAVRARDRNAGTTQEPRPPGRRVRSGCPSPVGGPTRDRGSGWPRAAQMWTPRSPGSIRTRPLGWCSRGQ